MQSLRDRRISVDGSLLLFLLLAVLEAALESFASQPSVFVNTGELRGNTDALTAVAKTAGTFPTDKTYLSATRAGGG